jgi:phage tail-like protein
MAAVTSGYLPHLPEILRASGSPGADRFLAQFLNIFEALLSGRDDARIGPAKVKVKGLEEIVGAYVNELDPAFTTVVASAASRLDSPFLSYLASWVALTLDENWELDRKRRWLQRIVSLYQRRGTREGLTEYLEMFVGNKVKIDEPSGFTLGKVNNLKQSSTLAVDTFLGGETYFFRIAFNHGFPEGIADEADIPAEPFDITLWRNQIKLTAAVADLEKPAHTFYRLDPRAPGIILGFKNGQNVGGHFVKGRATLATDTLIWQHSNPI